MNTKLTINLHDGVLDVEGSEDFVRSVYLDFKERVAKAAAQTAIPKQLEQALIPVNKPHVETAKKTKPSNPEGKKTKSAEYKPTFNTNLNLASLNAFYSAIKPGGHSEKILCFAIFLRDHCNISPCTADDIYTCYFTLKSETKIPEAFLQAFRDTQSKKHYIKFESPQHIEITIAGENYFNSNMKKKAE